MFTLISLLIEELSIIVCIHRIFGKKIRLDRRTISLIISQVCILSMVNYLSLGKIIAGFTFVFIFIYCKIKFKVTFATCVGGAFFLGVIMTALQFICLLLTNIIVYDNEGLRVMIANMGVLCCCVFVLPKVSLDRLRKNLFVKNKYVVSTFGVVGIVLALLLLQDKIFQGIQAELFVFAVPAVLVLIILFGKWNESQKRIEEIAKDLDNNIRLQDKYSELLQKVRLRQHEFKNHLTAIFSSHYTYKTYERLVEVQKEYCNKMLQENKYNGLLLIRNGVLSGFLYAKLQEIEQEGFEIEYNIYTNLEGIKIPNYYLIEILGILIDNAAEAYQNSDQQKKISLSIEEKGENYFLTIRNQCEYVPYSEMEQWFQMEASSKGEGRGLGLYHLKTLCNDWKMNIRCENIEIEQKNWIQFTLIAESAGNQK